MHLQDWPELPASWENEELRTAMDEVREVVSAAHSLRKTHQIRVRQPLRTMTVVTDKALEPFLELIASEVNVKNVELKDAEHSGMQVTRDLAVLPRELDGDTRKLTSKLFKAAREGDWSINPDGSATMHLADGDVQLAENQFKVTIGVEAEEGTVATVLDSGSFVALDTELDAELISEGYARDVVRAVQDARKAAGLEVSDRIELTLTVPEEGADAVNTHLEFIKHETLAVRATVEVGGSEIVAVTKRIEA